MKVTILQSNFAKALNQVSKVVGTRTTLPVLSNILIKAEKGKIKFSATDLEVGITTQTVGKVEEEGDITLPAKLLIDFVLNNRDESVLISTKETIATLKSSHFEAKIHGISSEEFPTVPKPPKEGFAELSSEVFADALRKVNLASANDDTRPVLTGIYLEFSGKGITLAATDSYRLAEKKLEAEKNTPERKLIVPSRTMGELLRLLTSGETASKVLLSATENQICFTVGDTYIVSRLIEGAFPNYTQIIPSGFKTESKTDLAELTRGVKMALLFARGTANNNIKISILEDKVVVSSVASEAGTAQSTVESEVKGAKVEVALNARYVLDVLNVISDQKVILRFNDSSSAGVIASESDKKYTYIIMPLKIEE